MPRNPAGSGAQSVKRASQSSPPAGGESNRIIFSGGVYVGENTSRLANVRAKRVRCGEPQPFQTRAQRSGSRLRACQKHFFDKLRSGGATALPVLCILRQNAAKNNIFLLDSILQIWYAEDVVCRLAETERIFDA